jgi:hypothetical protein
MVIFNKGALKENVEATLSKPEGQLLSDDIKTLLYSAKSDEELDLVVKAIQKYDTQSASLSVLKFNFDAPLMRLFYVLNKADKALELFMSNVNTTF